MSKGNSDIVSRRRRKHYRRNAKAPLLREPALRPTHVDKAGDSLAKEKIKVIVSDQRMPPISGVKFLREVKEQYPDVLRILFYGIYGFSAKA